MVSLEGALTSGRSIDEREKLMTSLRRGVHAKAWGPVTESDGIYI